MPTIKQLSRIFSDDSSLNRVQDQLASALNPILKNVQGDLSGPLEAPNVVGLQGRQVAPQPPKQGEILLFNGSQWIPYPNTIFVPDGITDISSATYQFNPNTTFVRFTVSGGNYTLSSTPTILTSNAFLGQMVLLQHIGTTGNIKLQRGVTRALSLASPNMQIDPGGSALLVFNGTYWVEVAHTPSTST